MHTMLSPCGILVASLVIASVSSFMPVPHDRSTSLLSRRVLLLHASGGKGFGNVSSSSSSTNPKKKLQYNEESSRTMENPIATDSPSNMGQKALQELRRQRAEQRDAELRKVREIQSVDEYIRASPDAAVIPEKVAMRMGKRMLPFVGLPLFGGMGAFVAFWYFATYKNVEFQPSLVAFTTIGILFVGLVGITYSVMSASWDEDVEGSLLGWTEFQTNVDSLKSGLSRSRENAKLREKMAGMSEAEIQAALRDLEKRETPSTTIQSEIQELKKDQWIE